MTGPGGKGHARRPTDEAAYSDGWDRIFSRKQDQALAEAMQAENLARATEQHAKDGNDAG